MTLNPNSDLKLKESDFQTSYLTCYFIELPYVTLIMFYDFSPPLWTNINDY